MPEVDPMQYFKQNDFRESHLVSIRHNTELKNIAFVVTYTDFRRLLPAMYARNIELYRREYDRDFRRLLFREAQDVKRIETQYRHGFRGFDAFDLNIKPRFALNASIDYVDVGVYKAGFRCAITMGSLGAYLFRFSSLDVECRLGKHVGTSDEQYLDMETASGFDYYDPFEDYPQ